MAVRDIIVVGASAGGVEALCQLVAGLPAGLPASVFVVCHFPDVATSRLPEILSGKGQLLAHHAVDGEPIYPGHIYVAPPNHHLVLEAQTVHLSLGPRENRFRPSIDPLFRSAARTFGPRVIAALLSGALSDGVSGLLAVRAAGGLVVLQDPRDAIIPSLPETARSVAGADHVATTRELGPLLSRLVVQPLSSEGIPAVNDSVEKIGQTALQDMTAQIQGQRRGSVSVFTCPECGGAMWQLEEKDLLRFRCHVGHAYAADVLLVEQSAALEAALWTAVRTFRERGVLARQLAHREQQGGNEASSARFLEEAELSERYGELIHQYLLRGLGKALAQNQQGPEKA